METLEQKKRRLIGKAKYLDTYIKTLNKITLMDIDSTMLLSIVDTDVICPIGIHPKVEFKTTLKFCEKVNVWNDIKTYLGHDLIYIWLDHGHECGLCPLDSIDLFNINFNFEDDPTGIIVLISNSSSKRSVVLDFYEENMDKKIDIEFRSSVD